MIKTIIGVIVGIVLGLVIGYLAFGGDSFAGTTHFSGVTVQEEGLVLEDGGDITLGAGSNITVAGTASITGTTTLNGMPIVAKRTATFNSSTTPWAVQIGATSTLAHAFCSLKGSTTASVLTFGKANTAFATTTVIATSTIAANAQGTINALATTTQNATLGEKAVNDRTFSPGQWLVLGMSGGIGTFSPTGACSAEFILP